MRLNALNHWLICHVFIGQLTTVSSSCIATCECMNYCIIICKVQEAKCRMYDFCFLILTLSIEFLNVSYKDLWEVAGFELAALFRWQEWGTHGGSIVCHRVADLV